jgi:hypothetical protein
MGKLRKLKLVGLGAQLDSKQKELGKWMSRTANSKNRNGFTRLRQDSEDEDERRLPLKKKKKMFQESINSSKQPVDEILAGL